MVYSVKREMCYEKQLEYASTVANVVVIAYVVVTF